MNGQTKKITISAMTAALAVVILLMAAVLPTGRIALVALAGLCMVPVVLSCRIPFAIGSFLLSGAIALLLSPMKGCAAAYLLFFGWYPIAKSPMERIKSRIAEWISKLLVFNAALAVAVLLFGQLMVSDLELPISAGWAAALLWLVANAAFILYDIAMSRIIFLYLNKFVKK